LDSDGALADAELNLDTARLLEQAGPWGQGFAAPLFENEFDIVEARAVGQQQDHARYRLRSGSFSGAAIHFHAPAVVPAGRVRCLYRLNVNRWNGTESADLLIELIEPL
ncbi:MAG TPA: single-stranded-DNA-specific exonuclease RecJ, partial [Nevskiaceae bacterium]|nr:single-stranded-DNA-specific exonuclease RecJ [Nevskiaceae bacterium]